MAVPPIKIFDVLIMESHVIKGPAAPVAAAASAGPVMLAAIPGGADASAWFASARDNAAAVDFTPLGLLFMVIGNYLGKVHPNWFLGVRTPWTLASELVWRKTNRTAGWLFVLAGLVIAVSAFIPSVPTAAVMGIAIALAALIAVVQSYVLWKKERTSASR
jgi:uncharacterized membrane protein